MSPETLTLLVGLTLLAALPITGAFALLVSAAHNHDMSVSEYCTCWVCLLAYRLDRHHGRHRMEDNYDKQRDIRADFDDLTPDS